MPEGSALEGDQVEQRHGEREEGGGTTIPEDPEGQHDQIPLSCQGRVQRGLLKETAARLCLSLFLSDYQGNWFGELEGDILVDVEVAAEDEGRTEYESKPGQVQPPSASLELFGEVDQGHLENDEAQEDRSDDAEDGRQQKLMKEGTEEEGAELGHLLAFPVPDDELQVDMAVEEHMNRFVPLAIELLVGAGIPPILVELPIVQS